MAASRISCALLLRWRLNGQSTSARIEIRSAGVQPLAGTLVVDFTRYLPGRVREPRAARLGARVVRVEPPAGDPMRPTATAWDTALRAGSESVVCDLPGRGRVRAGALRASRRRARGLPARGRRATRRRARRRPGHRRSTARSPASATTSATAASRSRRQLPRLGGRARGHRASSCPPIQIADLAAGALGAVDAGPRRAARARANRDAARGSSSR